MVQTTQSNKVVATAAKRGGGGCGGGGGGPSLRVRQVLRSLRGSSGTATGGGTGAAVGSGGDGDGTKRDSSDGSGGGGGGGGAPPPPPPVGTVDCCSDNGDARDVASPLGMDENALFLNNGRDDDGRLGGEDESEGQEEVGHEEKKEAENVTRASDADPVSAAIDAAAAAAPDAAAVSAKDVASNGCRASALAVSPNASGPPSRRPSPSPRSVSFADEVNDSATPLTTFRIIGRFPDEQSEGDGDGGDGGDGLGGDRIRRRPRPGEAYVGTPPLTRSEYDSYWMRVLILLLCPSTQQFEIVAIYYDTRERAGISNVLRLIPKAATSPQFAGRSKSRFSGLTRPGGAEGGTEMINALALGDYGVRADEVLVAIPRGLTGRATAFLAEALMVDERVEKLVSRICRTDQPSPPPTPCQSAKRALMRPVTKARRRIGKLLTAALLFVLTSMLVFWYLPDEWKEMIGYKSECWESLISSWSNKMHLRSLMPEVEINGREL